MLRKNKPKSFDLFYLQNEMATKEDARSNSAYIRLRQQINSAIKEIIKLSRKPLMSKNEQLNTLEKYYEATKTRLLQCNTRIKWLMEKLKDEYATNEDISVEDRNLIAIIADNVSEYAEDRINKTNPYKKGMAYFTKLTHGKALHFNDKDYLLQGQWMEMNESEGEKKLIKTAPPGYGLCYGGTLTYIDNMRQGVLALIPTSSKKLIYHHSNQKARKEKEMQGIRMFTSGVKVLHKGSQSEAISGYMLAKKVLSTMKESKCYLMSMRGFVDHATGVAMLPAEGKNSETNGYKYVLFDTNLHIGFYKNEEDFLSALAIIYDMIGAMGFTSIKIETAADINKQIPKQLSYFLKNHQNENKISISDIYGLIDQNQGDVRASRLLAPASSGYTKPLTKATNAFHFFLHFPLIFLSREYCDNIYNTMDYSNEGRTYFFKSFEKNKKTSYHETISIYLFKQFELLIKSTKYHELASEKNKEKLKRFISKSIVIEEMEQIEISPMIEILNELKLLVENDKRKSSENSNDLAKLIELFEATKDIELLDEHFPTIARSYPAKQTEKLLGDIKRLNESFKARITEIAWDFGDSLAEETIRLAFKKSQQAEGPSPRVTYRID